MEKSLNKNSFNVIPNHHSFNRNEMIQGESKFQCLEGEWGAKQMMIMDILGTIIIHKEYNTEMNSFIPNHTNTKVIEKSEFCMSKEIIDYIIKNIYLQNQEDNINKNYYTEGFKGIIQSKWDKSKEIKTISFTTSRLKELVPFLKKYTLKQIDDMIKSTSTSKLKINYPVRVGNLNVDTNLYNYTISNPFKIIYRTPIFENENRIRDIKYIIEFSSYLGYLFIQNSLSGWHDLVPVKFYDMSTYTQLLYRLLIAPYYGDAKNPIKLKEIKNRLNLITKDIYRCRQIVMKMLKELEKNKFIRDIEEIQKDGEWCYKYVKNSLKEVAN
jgi:hypothetical protein